MFLLLKLPGGMQNNLFTASFGFDRSIALIASDISDVSSTNKNAFFRRCVINCSVDHSMDSSKIEVVKTQI
jgi:hypothetical protein